MAATTRTTGTGKEFTTHQAAFDDLVVDCGGNMSGYGIQTMETYAGGTANIYDENISGRNGLINLGANDYVKWVSMLSFVVDGIATLGAGITLLTSVAGYVIQTASYTRIEGYNIRANVKANGAFIKGVDVGGDNCIIKNCFFCVHSAGNNNNAIGLYLFSKRNTIMANLCFVHTGALIGSKSIFQDNAAPYDIIGYLYHCTFFSNSPGNLAQSNVINDSGAIGASNMKAYNCISFNHLGGAKAFGNGSDVFELYNCISEDGTADDYSGSGNMVDKKPWVDLYIKDSMPVIWNPLSDAYNANYGLDSDPNREHYQNDIHGNLRNLKENKCSIGCSEYLNVVVGVPDNISLPSMKPLESDLMPSMKVGI